MAELNNEFDIKVRAQKHFEESVKEKVKNHQALNDKELEYLCPVAFKSTMTQSDYEHLVETFDKYFGEFVILER